jgi:aspartate--ammonia ligase
MKRMEAVYEIKRYVEDHLAKELGLKLVQVPLIVDAKSGFNDMLDRDGSRTPVEFPCGLGIEPRIRAQVVQAATKWKRMALQQFGCKPGEGINTDMRAVRKDYFLGHDHSSYVDQWDWERVITADQRNLTFLRDVVKKLWKVLWGAGQHVRERFPALRADKYPALPEELTFIHAEEILDRYPDLPRKQRETAIVQEYPAVFIIGIGQARTYMYLLRAAHLGEVTVTVWPEQLEKICAERNIHVLE